MDCPKCGRTARVYLSSNMNPVAVAAGAGPVRMECFNCGDSMIANPSSTVMWEAFVDSIKDEQEKQHHRVAATLARTKYIKDATGIDYDVTVLNETLESFDVGIEHILHSEEMDVDELTNSLVAAMAHVKYIDSATEAHWTVCKIVAHLRREEVPESCKQDIMEGEQ